jgi:hypothetical protein
MIRRVRKSRVTREEIIADAVFFFIPAFISFLAVLFFDIHQSFYSYPVFPLTFVFATKSPYIIGTLVGGLAGFFLIKLFLFGLKEEEIVEEIK